MRSAWHTHHNTKHKTKISVHTCIHTHIYTHTYIYIHIYTYLWETETSAHTSSCPSLCPWWCTPYPCGRWSSWETNEGRHRLCVIACLSGGVLYVYYMCIDMCIDIMCISIWTKTDIYAYRQTYRHINYTNVSRTCGQEAQSGSVEKVDYLVWQGGVHVVLIW